eukprot:TRINITY_DN13102_c0_g1_i1.p2 TRINITY_DN13102_c0_g1~~TRINITY_DN13102_c0_g1_i1.p2  ORF type:complete len:103 (-),score=35.91 TRINITY_DN13102_c0_g1_i1:29-337(-)
MCIRDRYQRRVHGQEHEQRMIKEGVELKKYINEEELKRMKLRMKDVPMIDTTSHGLISRGPHPQLQILSLIHISEPTRPLYISYAVFCLKKKKTKNNNPTKI